MLQPHELTLEEMGDLAEIIPAKDPEVRISYRPIPDFDHPSARSIIPQGIVIDHHDNLLDLGLDRGGHCRARPFGVNRVRCVNRAEQAEAEHGNKQHNHRNDG